MSTLLPIAAAAVAVLAVAAYRFRRRRRWANRRLSGGRKALVLYLYDRG